MIQSEFAISDLALLDLRWQGGVLTVITEDNHLLRRFGAVDVVNLEPDRPRVLLRHQADEIWTVLSGQAFFHLEDHREDSPSQGTALDVTISQDAPRALLIPFGVLCKVSSTKKESILLRISTHQDESHPGDTTLSLT